MPGGRRPLGPANGGRERGQGIGYPEDKGGSESVQVRELWLCHCTYYQNSMLKVGYFHVKIDPGFANPPTSLPISTYCYHLFRFTSKVGPWPRWLPLPPVPSALDNTKISPTLSLQYPSE